MGISESIIEYDLVTVKILSLIFLVVQVACIFLPIELIYLCVFSMATLGQISNLAYTLIVPHYLTNTQLDKNNAKIQAIISRVLMNISITILLFCSTLAIIIMVKHYVSSS